MPTKEKSPADVLTFFLNPNRKYMGHFFHLQGDIPTMSIITKKDRSGAPHDKTTFQTARERLYLSDIDAIIKKYSDLKGKHSLAEISLGILPADLLDTLEKNNLNIDQVIQWTKKVASEALAAAKEPIEQAEAQMREKQRLTEEDKMLIKFLHDAAPNKEPAELVEILRKMVADPVAMKKAETVLVEKENTLGRDPKTGYIRLRLRAHAS